MNKFYITSAIPYVNGAPHIGHALEFLQADAMARYHELLGDDVLFLTGSDENALKNVQAAEKEGKDVQKFVNENADRFEDLIKALNVRVDIFQRGSNQKTHFLSSQKLWNLCDKNGDIYQKEYTGLYCVGCETFYETSELNESGECFEHPGKKLVEVSEKNYFFKLSKYQNELIELIRTDSLKIIPETRKNEMLSFLKQPLQDISISRSNERAKNWGVPVPGDSSQRIYVWFDALNIYQSGIGFGTDEKIYSKWWPADVHVIGKGISRFHAIYWPAFLKSAKLPLPKALFIHGYITVEGQKMSKSVGNVIDPFDLVEKYGVDPVRYYLLREIPSYGDGDFSERRFKELYNADLANGLGNLVSRVSALIEKNQLDTTKLKSDRPNGLLEQIMPHMNQYQMSMAIELIFGNVAGLDKYLNVERPWLLDSSSEKKKIALITILTECTTVLLEIAEALSPFLPETAQKIKEQFNGKTQTTTPLFPRIV